MGNNPTRSKTSSGASLNLSQESGSTVDTLLEPFLNFDENAELSFDEKSTIYNSLVALVKARSHFDSALQDRAVRFLKNLEPKWNEPGYSAGLVNDLVPSSDGSPSGFAASIVTLLSSPHWTIVTAALSFLFATFRPSSAIQCQLVESDLISNVLAIVQPHTLPISGNETMINNLILIIILCLELEYPVSLSDLGITDAADQFNHREMIFQKVVLSSSQFVTSLISNRNILSRDSFDSFMLLLVRFIKIGPFHRRTLEFVVASPIAMAITSCLSFIDYNRHLWLTFQHIDQSLDDWKCYGPEVVESAKRMMKALFSEDFEDTLEQMLMRNKGENYGSELIYRCHSISLLTGSNVELTENDEEEESEVEPPPLE
ncbi:hypothetical protein BLNAU_14880 [Blattamonas nauphoetae]|uniref:Uncharacterized protein n=1 Tax=Blattamonas nauphoetae TaxID=2049346 RepID=A0ABQ9XES7_9EUKA|nr:hypothetical protein BLNAU_14880 [Blattamonas nauphoetae]